MTVHSDDFRAAMSYWASGVSLVTSSDGETRVGLTVSSFVSLSVTPPLILVCLDRRSSSLPVIQRAGHFAVNMLAEGQEELSRCFASRQIQDKFAVGTWGVAASGVPILTTALGWLDCQLSTCYDGGDHVILVGLVLGCGTTQNDDGPLLYYRRSYQQVLPAPLACEV